MSMRPRENDNPPVRKTPYWLEIAIFVLAIVVGVYGIGKGLTGFYEQGQQINLLWLAVSSFALYVLSAQMGRVHDTWPHRPDRKAASPSGPQPAEAVAPTHEAPDAASRKESR